ncbi:hypothetical protein BGZ81_008437 [Podila clonocystis]|nr:hypothetical protein BGZ81_008437 [Podila clonocystis]
MFHPHFLGQVWGSTSQLTNSESTSSSVYGSTSPWSGDTGLAFNTFTTAPSSSMSTIPNSQSFLNNQSRSTQQTNTQSFSQLSVSQNLSVSQGSAVRGWCSSQARRSVTTIQHTESSDDVAPSSQTSMIYVSSDSDTDSKDSGTLDVDSEIDSNEGDPGGDSDEDDSGDSDTTVRLQNVVMRFDSRAGQSLSRYSYSQSGSQLSQEQDAVYTNLQRRQPSVSSYEGWERQDQSEYSFSQGSEPSQELSDSEDGYSSRLQAFMDCRHGTDDDEAQSQELEYGVGSWFNNLSVPEWLSELDDADGDDDEGLFYEPLKRIRHH